MGVAFGQFVPADGYQAIQQECRANHLDQSALALCVRTEAGLVIPCAGIGILMRFTQSCFLKRSRDISTSLTRRIN